MECVDYVLLHELIHLKAHNHSPGFYRTLDRRLPEWQRIKTRLDSSASWHLPDKPQQLLLTDDKRMSDPVRAARFDFTATGPTQPETGTIKELLAELNEERGNRADGSEVGINSLTTTLNVIKQIIGREIKKSTTSPLSTAELKTIKRLYLAGIEHSIKLSILIGPPHLSNKPTLEFRESTPSPRNEPATLVVEDLLAEFVKEIPRERLDAIDRQFPRLPELLLSIEKENAAIGDRLKQRAGDSEESLAAQYRELATWIDAYPVHALPSTTPLNEAVYTYLRALRFAHFALGFQRAFHLAEINTSIRPIPGNLEVISFSESKRVGSPLRPASLCFTIDQLDEFVGNHKEQVVRAITEATGLNVDASSFGQMSELAKRLLVLYSTFHLGERNTNTPLLSVWDFVAALCTIRHEQEADTRDAPYWPTQKSQGDVVLRHLLPSLRDKRRPGEHRSIEELYTADYVPHEINQLVYQRFCNMQAALLGLSDVHEARMAFRVSRLKKLTEIHRANDVDQIAAISSAFLDSLQVQAEKAGSLSPESDECFYALLNKWLSDGSAGLQQQEA